MIESLYANDYYQYDNAEVSDQDIELLSHAAQNIVSEATGIECFAYANSAHIK
jgi:hypothetical protein